MIDQKHPQFSDYSEAWEAAAERCGSDPKTLGYGDYRASDAARLAASGLWEDAIQTLGLIGTVSTPTKETP